MSQTTTLARQFSANLRAEIGEDIHKVIALNESETDKGVCHSHDFCDANMPMNEGFTNVVGHEVDVNNSSDVDLWNKAWTIAKENKFYVK